VSRYVAIDELGLVKPEALEVLLTSRRWRLLGERAGLFRVWQSPDSEADVLIPLDESYRDYLTRLNEALVTIEKHFGSKARLMLNELVAGLIDELFFAKEIATVRGSVAWRIGERLVEGVREGFRSAARSHEQQLPHFGNEGLPVAQRYLRGIRMGQTCDGSFIVTALVPVGSLDDIGSNELPGLENRQPGFYREVTCNLMQATQAAVDAAREYRRTNSFAAFADSVDFGVSAEMVDSLATLASGGAETEIRAEWSPSIPEPVNIPNRVEVTPELVPLFKMASARFRESSIVNEVTVVGAVWGLERPRYGEAGISKMNVVEGSEAQRLRIRLSRDQYEHAIEAHRGGSLLRVTGEQVKEGNSYWLYNVRQIETIPVQSPEAEAALLFPLEWQESDDTEGLPEISGRPLEIEGPRPESDGNAER